MCITQILDTIISDVIHVDMNCKFKHESPWMSATGLNSDVCGDTTDNGTNIISNILVYM